MRNVFNASILFAMRCGHNGAYSIEAEWVTTSKHVEYIQFCSGMAPIVKEFWYIGAILMPLCFLLV